MKSPLRIGILHTFAAFVWAAAAGSASAQGPAGIAAITPNVTGPLPGVVAITNRPLDEISRSVPQAGSGVVTAAAHPSTVYRIGAGDLLRIDLKNSTIGVRYLKVREDGCIDFQLAGEMVCVAGLTASETSELLRRSIKLFAEPQISVEIREFASHVITISGLVEQPGQQQIQRDAVPFFVVRAGVVLSPTAKSVMVIRNVSEITERYDLSDARLGSVFVFPGDTVEFL